MRMFGLSGLLTRPGSTRAAQVTHAPSPMENEVSGAATASCQRWLAEWRDADEHAVELIAWLREAGVEGNVLSADMRAHHLRMCEVKGWLPRKWQPVARELARRTTGGRKVYAWVGERRRRIYPLHWARVCELSEQEPRLSVVE